MKRNALHLAALMVALTAVGLISTVPLASAQQRGSASSNSGLGFRGIGARIGYVDPENASGTAALGGHIDLGQFVRNVNLVPFVEYWSAGVAGYDRSDFTVATNVNVDFPLQGGTLIPYLGGGLGLHFLKAELPPGGRLWQDDDTKLGLHVLGGVRNQVMPNLGLFGELRFSLVDNTDQYKVMGGFTYYFVY